MILSAEGGVSRPTPDHPKNLLEMLTFRPPLKLTEFVAGWLCGCVLTSLRGVLMSLVVRTLHKKTVVC